MINMDQLIKLYRISKDEDMGQLPSLSEEGLDVEIFKPTILRLGLDEAEKIKRIFWYIITLGQYRVLYVKQDHKIAHYSFIIPRNFRFPFMKTGDLQIGPCFTYPDFRKRGIYTKVLRLIPKILGETGSKYWIYTTQNNLVSQKAIEKAGYGFITYLKSTSFLRILKQVKAG